MISAERLPVTVKSSIPPPGHYHKFGLSSGSLPANFLSLLINLVYLSLNVNTRGNFIFSEEGLTSIVRSPSIVSYPWRSTVIR